MPRTSRKKRIESGRLTDTSPFFGFWGESSGDQNAIPAHCQRLYPVSGAALIGAIDPTAIALEAPCGALSYGELDQRAGELAGALRAAGVIPGTVVAVCLPRSNQQIVALLAAWRAGAAYLPLDPAWPDARLAASLFAPAERSALAALCPEDGQRAFFDCWARKEAFVKALGLGLSYPLDAFAVAIGPQPELLAGGAGWTLAALPLGPDFAGAVVMADDGQGLSLHLHAGTELSCEARQAIDPPAMCAYHSAS